MKSNKETKENLSTEAEPLKDSSKTIKEIFEKMQSHMDNVHVLPSGIRIGFEELKSEILQKIKELEHEIDRLKSSKRWYSEEQIGEFHTQINKQSEEVNQLKSKLNSHTEKIKEILKNSKLCDWERILELKSLLSDKND